MQFQPAYLRLFKEGELIRRVESAKAILSSCLLCAHRCGADRTESSTEGLCQTGARAKISSWGAHHGEEKPLGGWRGSGTIFFGSCNLSCVYCQNWDISQRGVGREVTPEELADLMLALQEKGCHNINFVSPSHVVAQILEATLIAVQKGLRLPLVYNTGGYDCLGALRLLDGVIDIYMPDMKYGGAEEGLRYSIVSDYPAINQAAVREMHRQVGDLHLDEQGIAWRGLLVRHLVLPNGLAQSRAIFKFLAEEISLSTYLNIMDQYHPSCRADEYPELRRRISRQEYTAAMNLARSFGLTRTD